MGRYHRQRDVFEVLFLALSFTVVHIYGLSAVSGKKVAILQSKGGGHGEIGFALAKALLGKNEVVILQDPQEDCSPFASTIASLFQGSED